MRRVPRARYGGYLEDTPRTYTHRAETALEVGTHLTLHEDKYDSDEGVCCQNIGLALVKSFVELHHGEARVESELGKGSDFIVVIPRKQEGDSQVIHNDVDIVDNSANASASEGKNVVDESVLQYIDDGDRFIYHILTL